jgi:Tol biopolymer transport system component
MKKYMLFLTVFILSISISPAQIKLDFKNPPTETTLLAESFISTSINERDFALSPDGTEIYFTISTPQSTFQTIVLSTLEKSGWSKPEIVSFAGKFSDLEPAFSDDGKKMYFASNRPLTGGKPKDFDIWVVERQGKLWGEPKNLGEPINTELDEFYPSITKKGNLYFTAQYQQGIGKEDIFMAAWKNDHFEKPFALDTAVNSKNYEFNAFVDPDEQFILYTSYGRKDDMGRGDLYMSVKDAKGKWLPSKNLTTLNSNRLDYCPYVSPDKKILLFTSERNSLPTSFEIKTSYNQIKEISSGTLNGTGNIYWISFDKIIEAFQKSPDK